jgi:hypothetical protein
LTPTPAAAPGSSSAQAPKAWKNGDSASFRDVLDIINPLQHLPVVGTIYRAITGDTIGAMSSIIGGTIFGGPVGLVLSLADNAIKAETGRNVGETALAALGIGSPAGKPAEPPVAAAGPKPDEARPKLVIDIPAPRHQGESRPAPFADGKPPVIISLPQPQWAPDAASAPQMPAPASPRAGLPLSFQSPPAQAQAQAPGPAQPMPARAEAPRSLSSQASPLANARFRSTDLPTQLSVLR